MKLAMHIIFWQRDVKRAMQLVRFVVSQIWLCRVPLAKLTFSKEWSKEDYANPQPHIEVARKRSQRDPTQAYELGDRIPYLITPFDRKQKLWQAAEDPSYCLKTGTYVDQAYYIEALEGPLGRLFEPIIGETATRELFHGEHTRRRKVRSGVTASRWSGHPLTTPAGTGLEDWWHHGMDDRSSGWRRWWWWWRGHDGGGGSASASASDEAAGNQEGQEG